MKRIGKISPDEFYDVKEHFNVDLEKLLHSGCMKLLDTIFSRQTLSGIGFPYKWNFGPNPSDGRGGAPVDDPLSVYLDIYTNEHSCSYATYDVGFRERALESFAPQSTEDVLSRNFIQALRDLANELEVMHDNYTDK
jgi:hypothetical protein